MGDYLQQQVQQHDIHFIVSEITQYPHCIENKSVLHGALSLPESNRVDLMHQYQRDGLSYDYFNSMLSTWVSLKASEATTLALDKALRDINWKAPADNIRDKWFNEVRSTTVAGQPIVPTASTSASQNQAMQPQSINTSFISGVSTVSNANFSNISVVGYQANNNR